MCRYQVLYDVTATGLSFETTALKCALTEMCDNRNVVARATVATELAVVPPGANCRLGNCCLRQMVSVAMGTVSIASLESL